MLNQRWRRTQCAAVSWPASTYSRSTNPHCHNIRIAGEAISALLHSRELLLLLPPELLLMAGLWTYELSEEESEWKRKWVEKDKPIGKRTKTVFPSTKMFPFLLRRKCLFSFLAVPGQGQEKAKSGTYYGKNEKEGSIEATGDRRSRFRKAPLM